MKKLSTKAAAFACAAALVLSTAGCGQPEATQQQEASGQSQAPAGASQRDETDPTADGRIDVTATGEQVATYRGAKYIVSDVTIDQEVGDRITEGLGLQEICVVNQPESWESIESIGWDRNSISYAKVAMPWGTVSYRYSYINEASGVEGIEDWSSTNEKSYFEGYDNVEHVDVNGHTVAYITDTESTPMVDMGIEDLEAKADGTVSDEHAISVYAYEQRDDKCAFLVSISCAVNDSAVELSAEDLIKDAYAPLEFAEKGSQVNAASFVSDLTIANADGSASVVIARKGDALISYTEHSVMLLGDSDSLDTIASTTYSFAPEDAPDEDAETYEIDGRTVRARLDDFAVVGWVDVDGGTLRVESNYLDGEDAQAALERALTGRLS